MASGGKRTGWRASETWNTRPLRGLQSRGAHSLGALASANATSEELYLLQKFMRALGSNNIDHRIHQCDFSDEAEVPVFPWLGLPIHELEQLDAALIVGGNP